jgi:hypothetical protein
MPGISQHSPWPQRDEELRREMRAGGTWDDIANRMGLTYYQIKGRSERLKLRKLNAQQERRVSNATRKTTSTSVMSNHYPRCNGQLMPGVRTLPLLPSLAAIGVFYDANEIQDNDE